MAADRLFERVVFGVDFASTSLAAAKWATQYVARRTHGLLSHVVPFPELLQGEEDADAPNRQQGAMFSALRGGLGGFAATLDLATSRAVLRIGRPSKWLSAIANQTHASLVVLGRRQRATRDWIGEPSVAERIAKRTSAALLMVPEGTRDRPTRVIALADDASPKSLLVRIGESLARINECALALWPSASADRTGAILVAPRNRYDLLSASTVPVLLVAS